MIAMKRIKLLALASLLAVGFTAQAEDSSLEPEVVITPSKDKHVKEFRVNGRLFMIEVKPEKGRSYFLVDKDGDGLMESRFSHTELDNIVIPKWTLLSW